ncbi:MAG TPA: ABC transporter ATP-binding protein [Candidatus Limnocylindria bacterium]|jgi:branched-chain amino acid transport system ATP-binding protein|nr:ABC transporter ATP-binding protein [Candidatus Limnocylindria bacterium]
MTKNSGGSTARPPALQVHALHAYYGESHVLQGVDLEVGAGEAVALVGRNGAGKTTTLAAIAGFLRPRQGSVRVNDVDLTGAPPHRIARAGVALVPQGRRIFGDLRVRENLAIAARPVTEGWDERRVLELFPSLARRLEVGGDQLSGGEQQMLALARALMRNPSLLLLDEPSEGLAPTLVEAVGEALLRLRASGLALLLVEQNLSLATRVGQRVHVMNKGTIVFSGTPAELAAARDVESRYLGI